MAIRSYSARAWSAASPRSRRIWSSLACVFAVGLIAAGGGAASAATPDSVAASTAARAMAVYDATLDSTWMFLPRLPDDEGSCYLYPRYIAVAWRSPDLGEPVAIVRERDPADSLGSAGCSPDSLAGDFVIRNEWAEYFGGMWHDLVLIDSGTCSVRSLFLYDVPSRRQVFAVHGYGETEGWIDSTTLRIWVSSGGDFPRSLCPDIPEGFGVGVDSLFAFDLKTLSMKALGPWRCNALQ